MENNKWQVSITHDGPTVNDKLFIYRHIGNRKVVVLKFTETGDAISETVEVDGSVDDTCSIRLRTEDMRGIVSAFVAYARSQGFKESSESFSEGKLAATEKHLEDMRTLVFKPSN